MADKILTKLLNKRVFVSCGNYAYDGIVQSVDHEAGFVSLTKPRVVYETGSWMSKEWAHSERLPTSHLVLSVNAIESIFTVER